MKKIVIVIISIIIIIVIAWFAPPIASHQAPTVAPISKFLPTPKPIPVVKINNNSNLSEEAKKLNVPDYQSDYSVLDKTLSQF